MRREEIKHWDPILPHRAIYICDENCSSTCEGCKTVIDGIKYTTDVIHAKNGPVVNVREWETRFKIKMLKDGLLYYCEGVENGDSNNKKHDE